MSNRDPNVRAIAVVALRERPTSEHVEMLIRLLNDPSPRVRNTAREALHVLAAREEYHRQVSGLTMLLLETEEWHAAEQAAILLGMLDHKPAVKPLIGLLHFGRPETFIAAAWAIKKLGVPDSLPDALEAARKRTSLLKAPGPQTFRLRVDSQLSQLFQLFGKLKYAPAESLLREFIPRGPQFRFESRATAIWALGRLHIDDPETNLTPAFVARLKDVTGTIVEDPRIRRMAAVSLGRMKAESALDELERFYKAGNTINHDIRDVGYACAWAIRRITDKNWPDPPIPNDLQQGWFLEPID
jgi:HEAT repeat protein